MTRRKERLPDYRELADRYGVTICTGPPYQPCGIGKEMHRQGVVRVENQPTVHWGLVSLDTGKPRIVTRKGIYKFLKLVHLALSPYLWTGPRWFRIYESSHESARMGSDFNIRVARAAMDEDRAKVRFLLSDPASRDTPVKEKVWRWAQERT